MIHMYVIHKSLYQSLLIIKTPKFFKQNLSSLRLKNNIFLYFNFIIYSCDVDKAFGSNAFVQPHGRVFYINK